jgi:hypothetical protein
VCEVVPQLSQVRACEPADVDVVGEVVEHASVVHPEGFGDEFGVEADDEVNQPKRLDRYFGVVEEVVRYALDAGVARGLVTWVTIT